MDPRKRSWIWGGLGLASSAHGLVTEAKKGAEVGKGCLRRGARLLAIGDATARGLSPALRQMSLDQGVLFRTDGRPKTTIADWAEEPWLAEHLRAYPATLTVISLGLADLTTETDLAFDLARIARTLRTTLPRGVPAVWILPPRDRAETERLRAPLRALACECFPSEELVLPRGQDGILPTAIGYAGWAGAIWRWLA